MFSESRHDGLSSKAARILLTLVTISLFLAPALAQRRNPPPPAKAPAAREAPPQPPDLTFETLLAADRYKLYGEVRNVGTLLNTGGVGEIVEPIVKLADPPKEFKSIIKFLKANAEPLATCRLLFAAWPARTDLPGTFVAI